MALGSSAFAAKNVVTAVAVGAQPTVVTYGTVTAVSYTVTITMSGGAAAGNAVTPTLIAGTLPTGASGAMTSGTLTYTGTFPTGTFTPPAGATTGTLIYTVTNTAATTIPGTTSGLVITASDTSGAFTYVVNTRPVTLTGSKTYDGTTAAPAAVLTVSNKVGADAVTVASGIGTLASANVGSPSISSVGTLTLGGAQAARYTLTGASGSVTLGAAALSITANADSKTYGQTKSYGAGSTAFTSSGLQNSETIGTVTITASGGTAANAAVGGYNLTPSAATGGTFTASNYSITYNNGTLTVNKAPLTVTATGPSKTYGTALTTGTSSTNFTHSGEVNGELVTSVTLTPNAAGLSATTAAGAAYVVTPSLATGSGGFLESNYTVTYNAYNGTVSTAALSITANADSKTYGQTKTYGAGSTAFTSSGLQNSETIGTVTITASGGTAANAAVGGYNLTPSAATGGTFTASNYSITYNNGTLTVNALAVTLSGLKTYDGTTNVLAADLSVTNIVGSDVVTVASGTGTLNASSLGTHSISSIGSLVLGGAQAANYTLSGASGSVTIDPGALDHFAISTITSPQAAGTAITSITLTAQDFYNNTLSTGPNAFTGTVTYSGTAGITGTSAAFTAGVLSGVSVTPMVAGTGKTFIVTGSGKTGTATFDVDPGALDHFVISAISSPQTAGTAITGITLTAQDVNNNTATSFVSTVAYSGTAGITGTSAAFTAGVLSGVSVTPMVAGTGMTFIVTASSKTGTATFNVIPGSADATYSTLTPTSASIAADGVSTQVLTVTAKDANGNLLTSGGSTVAITLSSGTGTIGSVTDNSNGTYSATVTSATSTGSGIFVATLGGNPVKSGTGSQTQATVAYVIYVWNQTGTASWTTAANWTPARTTPAVNDVVQFSGGGTVTATDVPNETIGRLLLSGNSAVNLQPTSGSVTLTVSNALVTTSGDVLNLGSGVIMGSTSATLTNGGTMRTAVLTSTSATPIPIGKTWGGNVEYDGSGAQTVSSGTYNQLTLAGSGTKTLGGNTTVNSTLSMQGTAAFGLGSYSLTYGTGAGLEYAGSASQTTGPELPTSMSANVTINNTNGVVTLGSSTTFATATWSVASGVALEVTSGRAFTINSGTLSTAGSGKVILDDGSNYINLTGSAPTLQVKRTITGAEGWRMLAAPDNVTVGSMFAGNFVTQGFTGSSFPSLQPNLLWWEETDQGTSLQAWRTFSATSDAVTLGRGYMFYAFNGDSLADKSGKYSDGLPLTMAASGTEQPLASAFHFNVTATTRSPGPSGSTYVDTNYANYGWNLIGNPTPSTIDWNASSGWTKTNVDGTIYIWNPSDTVGGYKTWNGTTGSLGSGKIAPFQAFWVKANAASPQLTCDNNVKSTGGTFLGKTAKDSIVPPPVLTLNLSANGLQTEAYLMFSPNGKLTYDPHDAFSLVPLSEKYLILYSVAGQGQPAMQIQNLPDTGFTDPITLPLYVGGTVGGQPLSGSFTLSWNLDGQLPAGWNIALMDDCTGKAYPMIKGSKLTLGYDTPADLVPSGSSFLQKMSGVASNQRSFLVLPQPVVHTVPAAKLSKGAAASRFRVVISAHDDLSGYLPTTPELAQNYPNPFNPSTNISFSVPERSRVLIQIFNILGQNVKTLIDEDYPAGKHVVVWNATGTSSGVYFCTMIVGNHTRTKKTVLLR